MTGGYIVGFLFTAAAVGLAADYIKVKSGWLRAAALVAAMVVGVALCYLFGTIWFIYVYNAGADTTVTFAAALMTCVVPYILPDLVKIVCAAALVTKLKKYMKL